MNCEEFKDALVVRIYGELPAEEEEALERHATGCEGCALALARTREFEGALGAGEHVPEPDWEGSWRVIRERSRKRSKWNLPAWFERPALRFATAAAAVVAVFVVGVLAGRSLFFSGPVPDTAATYGETREIASLADYTQTLEPLLIDFMNRRGGAGDDEVAEFTRRVVADMLAETRLLKRAAAREGDEQLYFLLEDVELVLISIANLGGQNGDVAGQLEQVIRDKSIMHRLKQLPAGSETI